MHSFRKNQFRMMGVLSVWLIANRTAIGQSRVAGREADDVINGFPAVQSKAGQTSVQTRTVTRRRNQQKKDFHTQLFSLLGPLRLIATRENDVPTLGQVTIGRTAYKAMRPDHQAAVGAEILLKARKRATDLADHGLLEAHLAAAEAAHQAFQQGLPDTQVLLDARKNANALYEEVHEAQMQQIYELDLAMSVFETLNPDLHRQYRTARAILDTGTKGKAEKQA